MSIILEKSVGSRKSTQPIDVPGKPEKILITNKVTTSFSDSPCTPMTYAPVSCPTEFSRIILTLFFRQGCHLCEDMADHLIRLRSELGFVLKTVDIDQNDVLRARYDSAVPVLNLADEELCRYFMDEVTVRNALAMGVSNV